jgi:hypothetical protein
MEDTREEVYLRQRPPYSTLPPLNPCVPLSLGPLVPWSLTDLSYNEPNSVPKDGRLGSLG